MCSGLLLFFYWGSFSITFRGSDTVYVFYLPSMCRVCKQKEGDTCQISMVHFKTSFGSPSTSVKSKITGDILVLIPSYSRGAQTFQKSTTQLKIIGAKRVT